MYCKGLGDDAFGGARGAAQQRFELLDNPATQRALSAYCELQQGKTAQNFIKAQIIDGAEQDVAALLKTLESRPEALQSIRAGVLQHLEHKAINPSSGQFSGAVLNKELKRIGEGKLAAVLGPEQFARLQSLARAGLDATYQPPYAAVQSSNTTPTLLSLTRGARSVPALPLLVTEGAENTSARFGYQKQLADALLARAEAAAQPNEMTRRLAEALARSSNASAAPAAERYRSRFR